MNYIYRLNREPYPLANSIELSIRYQKGIGYQIMAGLIENLNNGLIGKSFSKEYYSSGGDMVCKTFPCGRKSNKQKLLAESELNEPDKREFYYGIFLDHIRYHFGNDIDIVHE